MFIKIMKGQSWSYCS